MATMCRLHFYYWPVSIKRPVRMCSDIRYQRLQNLVWMILQQIFMLTSKRHSQHSDNIMARLSFPFRTELVEENTIFGTQQTVWKERLWDKSVLEENIRTVTFTTGGIQQLLCVELYIQSSERQASETVLRLTAKNYIDAESTFPPPVWSECSASSSSTTIKACESFHAHFNALFYSTHPKTFDILSALQKIQNETYIKMRNVSTRRLKKSATVKKEDSISSKIGQCKAKLI